MAYTFLTQYDAASYTVGRQGCSIDKIIIHHWGADGQTFESVVGWFTSPSCPTSAHAVLEEGRVACMVDYGSTAYHAGNWEANLTSIGIECRPEMSSGDIETLCEYIADLWQTYGVLPIYGHKDFSPTACPGRYYSKLDYIYARAMDYYNDNADGNNKGDDSEAMKWDEFAKSEEYALLKRLVKNSKETKPSEWAKDVWQDVKDAKLMDGTRPKDTVTREELAAVLMRLAN